MASARSGGCPFPRWFFDRALPELGLSPTAVVVFGVVWQHAGADRLAWPAQRTIAELSGLSRSTVQLALTELLRHGVLVVSEPGGARKSAVYEIPSRMPRRGPRFLPQRQPRQAPQKWAEEA